eukprot:1153836-Pelagomonas_calceolata.AAC.2
MGGGDRVRVFVDNEDKLNCLAALIKKPSVLNFLIIINTSKLFFPFRSEELLVLGKEGISLKAALMYMPTRAGGRGRGRVT